MTLASFNVCAQASKGYKFTKNLVNSNIKWDTESMYKWLENPKNMVKGTSMAFPGFKKETDRNDVIAYLNTLDPNYVPEKAKH
jgi:cytochrome c